MKKIILIMLGLSISLVATMERNSTTGIVTDSVTTLQWQDNTALTNQTWADAIIYCEGLVLSGYSDWRLPNINELTSLIDYTYSNSTWFFPAFVSDPSLYYWSSTTDVRYSGNAWFVHFHNGLQYRYDKSNSYYVRCVRAGQ